MDFRFKDKSLQRLYTDREYTGGYAVAVVSAFRRRMQTIQNAPDERTFYGLRSLHFEKLKGDRSHQRSMKLNDQWRLVMEMEGKASSKVVLIVAIEDYH